MKIGELARRAGVAPSKIRFLEARGLLRADRLANGYRDYGEDAVSSLQIILLAQSVGFTLEEIERALGEHRSQPLNCADMVERLKAKLIELDQHIAQSTAVRDRLAQMIVALTERDAENRHVPEDLPIRGPKLDARLGIRGI
ncbi:MerR family transcriptional regulator [Aliidongia dinghuensis]|uniref:MerR family transcriptional regulator n=1 Tax=Aliidongia dinghuensis TaxID=1867774 RepID=A0A8J3E1P8_9PROT|nr:MerR family transcriptional regulator [Aliidongia dinghuensis]GGF01735.1 MerR family transcriptional regulator [Aliidongia dinghuensis]